MHTPITSLDWIIIAAYLLAIVGLVSEKDLRHSTISRE